MPDNNDVLRALGRLEGKCDSIIDSLKDHSSRMNRIDQDVEDLRDVVFKKVSKQDKEIATLQKKQYGLFLVGGILGTAILAAFRKFF